MLHPLQRRKNSRVPTSGTIGTSDSGVRSQNNASWSTPDRPGMQNTPRDGALDVCESPVHPLAIPEAEFRSRQTGERIRAAIVC
jgi:hypothetical protein